MRSMDLVHTFRVKGCGRMLFSPCGSLRIKPLREMCLLCNFLRCAYIGAVFLLHGSVQQFGKLVNSWLRFEGCSLTIQVGKETPMCIHEVTADNHPSAYTFWCGDIMSVRQEFEEIDKICLLAYPMDFAIGVTSGEERKEISRIGVRCNPTGTEQALIELDDTSLLRFEPTIGEGS